MAFRTTYPPVLPRTRDDEYHLDLPDLPPLPFEGDAPVRLGGHRRTLGRRPGAASGPQVAPRLKNPTIRLIELGRARPIVRVLAHVGRGVGLTGTRAAAVKLPPVWLIANLVILLAGVVAVVPRLQGTDAAAGCQWYTIQRGDTLGNIGWAHHMAALTLVRANHIANPNLIYVGQRICIPVTAWAQAHTAPPQPSDPVLAAPTAPASTVYWPNDAAHYVAKYGFDWPGATRALSADERQRLVTMLPFALSASAKFNARYGLHMEPQLLLFWTHAEGIGARVNYSNCANERPPAGTSYFTHIANCDTPGFWQLGYGNQFSVIGILKAAFQDMYGNPNDPALVQRIGQAVLNSDLAAGTTPRCGGYSCTFPSMTIDQIIAGVSLQHSTTNNWWASVLSRDPGINSYMDARALSWFSHAATRNWVGCYYNEPCWGYESNRLGDILAAWPSLRAAAGV